MKTRTYKLRNPIRMYASSGGAVKRDVMIDTVVFHRLPDGEAEPDIAFAQSVARGLVDEGGKPAQLVDLLAYDVTGGMREAARAGASRAGIPA